MSQADVICGRPCCEPDTRAVQREMAAKMLGNHAIVMSTFTKLNVMTSGL